MVITYINLISAGWACGTAGYPEEGKKELFTTNRSAMGQSVVLGMWRVLAARIQTSNINTAIYT